MEAEYRRQQTNLFFSGLAMIAFGLWSAIKLTMYTTMFPENIEKLVTNENTKDVPLDVVIPIVIGVVIAFILVLHFFIGLSAVRDARRKTRLRIPNTVVAAMYAAAIFISNLMTIGHLGEEGKAEDFATSVLIDLTSIIALVIIITSSAKLSRLRKQQLAAGD